MKKKFDFTSEMKEVQVTKSTPQNEYLEEEKRLLDGSYRIGRFIRKIQTVYYSGYARAGCKIWQYRSWPVY